VTKIVERGDTAPNQTAFLQFSAPAISGSNIAFIGHSAGGSGLFLASAGTLTPLINYGDPLFGSTVTFLGMGVFGFDNNTLAFNYRLADGRSGFAVATVPEPSTLLFAALGLVSLGFIARRKNDRRPLLDDPCQ
jgi:hypothetical protein